MTDHKLNFKSINNLQVNPNDTGTGGTLSFQMVAPEEIGDHYLWIRRGDPLVTTGMVHKLAGHKANCAMDIQYGDWLVGTTALEQRELDDLVFHFGRELCIFTGCGGQLLWGNLHGALIWLKSIQTATGPHDAYIAAQSYMLVLNSILKTIEFRTHGVQFNKWVARYNPGTEEAYDLVDLTTHYAEPVLVRVLTQEVMKAQNVAPKCEDYTNPTWGEFVAARCNEGDLVFR